MDANQEPKYAAVPLAKGSDQLAAAQGLECRIVNRKSGELIPDDEPVIIFRARDALASDVIRAYLGFIEGRSPASYSDLVRQRLRDFERFASEHPERMKIPD